MKEKTVETEEGKEAKIKNQIVKPIQKEKEEKSKKSEIEQENVKSIKKDNSKKAKQEDKQKKNKIEKENVEPIKKDNSKKAKQEDKQKKSEIEKENVEPIKKEDSEETNKEKIDKLKDSKVIKSKKESHASYKISELNENFNIKSSDKITIKSKKKKVIIFSIILISFIIFFGIVSTIFALLNINNKKIMAGVSIEGIDVSNLTPDQAKEKLNNLVGEVLSKDINIRYNEYGTSYTAEQLDTKFDVEEAVNKAYNIGRAGNIIQNNYKIIFVSFNKENIDLNINMNEETIDNIINNIDNSLPDKVIQSSYYIENNNLIITSGTKGRIVEREVIKKEIINSVSNILKKEIHEIQVPVKEIEPDKVDIDKIHSEVYKEPQNAYITKEPFKLYVHVDGIDFDVDQAKEMIKENKESYTIPLKITKPEITTDKLGAEAFPHLLGTFSTNYGSGTSNRGINIQLAAKAINGIVLSPGDVFSYNRVVGDTTPQKGYKLGGSYLNGELVESYGGGICQVSSTLYNSVLYANLEIVMRYNHSSSVGYVPASRDATVSYGGKDFQFKNSREYPIKIISSARNGVLRIDIYGIKEEVEYEVVLESRVIQSIPYTTKYVENNSMEIGKEVVKSKGSNGFKSVGYKVLKLNGAVVSRTTLSQDTYNPMQRVIERGTKEVSTVEDTNPEVNNQAENNVEQVLEGDV